jgi:hypothetical protein
MKLVLVGKFSWVIFTGLAAQFAQAVKKIPREIVILLPPANFT